MVAYLRPILAIKSRRSNWQHYLFKKLSGARTFSNDFLEKVSDFHFNLKFALLCMEVANEP